MTEVIEGATRQSQSHWLQHASLEVLSGIADANLLVFVTKVEASDVEAKLQSLTKPQVRAAKVVAKPESRQFVCKVDYAASRRCG